jgi:hypothetical protein
MNQFKAKMETCLGGAFKYPAFGLKRIKRKRLTFISKMAGAVLRASRMLFRF